MLGIVLFAFGAPAIALAHAPGGSVERRGGSSRAHGEEISLLLQRSAIVEAAGRPDAAARGYERILSLDPHQAEAHLGLAKLLLMGGNLPEAQRVLNSCVPADVPAQLQKLQLQADILSTLSRWNEAATVLDRALAINPNPRPEDYIERADLSLNAGLPTEAMDVLNRGIERLNNSVALRWRAVGVAIRARLTDAALVQLEQLEKMLPGSALVHARRGDVFAACGRNEEANAAWNEALSRIESIPAQERSPADQSLAERLRRNLNVASETAGSQGRD